MCICLYLSGKCTINKSFGVIKWNSILSLKLLGILWTSVYRYSSTWCLEMLKIHFFNVLAMSAAYDFVRAWLLLQELTGHLALKAIKCFAMDFTDAVIGTVWLGYENSAHYSHNRRWLHEATVCLANCIWLGAELSSATHLQCVPFSSLLTCSVVFSAASRSNRTQSSMLIFFFFVFSF